MIERAQINSEQLILACTRERAHTHTHTHTHHRTHHHTHEQVLDDRLEEKELHAVLMEVLRNLKPGKQNTRRVEMGNQVSCLSHLALCVLCMCIQIVCTCVYVRVCVHVCVYYSSLSLVNKAFLQSSCSACIISTSSDDLHAHTHCHSLTHTHTHTHTQTNTQTNTHTYTHNHMCQFLPPTDQVHPVLHGAAVRPTRH